MSQRGSGQPNPTAQSPVFKKIDCVATSDVATSCSRLKISLIVSSDYGIAFPDRIAELSIRASETIGYRPRAGLWAVELGCPDLLRTWIPVIYRAINVLVDV